MEIFVYVMGLMGAVYLSLGPSCALVKYNYLIMAVILSSFAKPFLLLTMVWQYELDFNALINAFILVSNTVALQGESLPSLAIDGPCPSVLTL